MLNLVTFGAALIALSTAAASRVSEKAGYEQVQATVFYGDLDLSTAAGIEALKKRIETAAAKACGPVDHSDPAAVATVRDCIESMKASAGEAARKG